MHRGLGSSSGFLLLLLCLAACGTKSLWAEDTPEKLIHVLETGDFDERKGAEKKLTALGEQARPALEKALKESDSPETRDTITKILAAMQRSRVLVEAVDILGKPIPNAEADVVIQPAASIYTEAVEFTPQSMKTDASGTFALPGCNPGIVCLNVIWKNHHLAEAGNIFPYFLRISRGDTRVRYVLQSGGSVSGTIIDAVSRQPLAGSAVLIADNGLKPVDLFSNDVAVEEPLRAGADAKGEFTISNVPPGRYFLYGSCADYRTSTATTLAVKPGSAMKLDKAVELHPAAKDMGNLSIRFAESSGDMKQKPVQIFIQRIDVPASEAQGSANRALPNLGALNGADHPDLNAQQLQTSEDGVLDLKGLHAGRYHIVLQYDGAVTWLLPDVQVKPGVTVDIDKLTPAKTGGMTGSVTNATGTPLNQLTVWPLKHDNPRAMSILSQIQLYNHFVDEWESVSGDVSFTDEKGRFEVKNLLPGRYSLCLLRGSTLLGLVHSVEISAEKINRLPEIRITSARCQFSTVSVRGFVLLPDGNPAQNASVTLMSRDGISSGVNSGDNGGFALNEVFDSKAASVMAVLDGYRPVSIDVSRPGVDLHNLKLQLEKQAYGSLAVTVRDTAGVPLSGAEVSPLHNPRAGFVTQAPPRQQVTDKAGRAVLKGLAWGKRYLHVSCDGYFLEQPVEVAVVADKETPVAITLKKGFSLKGTLEMPAGVDPKQVRLALQETKRAHSGESLGAFQLTTVDSTGQFNFSGLHPGDYLIIAQYPGMGIHPDRQKLQITDRDVELKAALVPLGGTRLALNPECAGAELSLVPEAKWKGASPEELSRLLDERSGTVGSCNSLGEGVLHGYSAGNYTLLLQPPVDVMASSTSTVRAARFSDGLVLGEVKTTADASTLPEKRVTVAPAKGVLKGRLSIKIPGEWPAGDQGIGSVRLLLIGEQACARFTYSLPEEVDPAFSVTEIGQPPTNYTARVPGAFKFTALPAGSYKLYARLCTYDGTGWNWQLQDGTEKMVLLKTLSLNDDQVVDAGDCTFEIAPAQFDFMLQQAAKMRAATLQLMPAIGEDEPIEFQP
ncbi:MAG TPA: carboxypeptidase regulatory-like domain-containing protein [Planctomycetota bacterium]|nr:carboxypeptidase regulatory-like domain-containing protein [Planctomycetota bacterium]